MTSVFLYACLWLSFGIGHSLLTVPAIKQRLEPIFGSTYRLSYNVFATIHIGIVFLLGRHVLSGNRFDFFASSFAVLIAAIVMFVGAGLILLSLRQYDLGQFSGLAHLRAAKSDKQSVENEELNVNGLNGWVRHPLYSGLFLLVWGNAISPFGFWTAVFASIYLIVGAHFEERKLIGVYGEQYQLYQSRIPAFIPSLKKALRTK